MKIGKWKAFGIKSINWKNKAYKILKNRRILGGFILPRKKEKKASVKHYTIAHSMK